MDIGSHRHAKTGCFLFLIISTVLHATPVYAGLDRARKAGFIPHKALYDIRLSAKKSSATVSNITGTMFYEWQPSCDAWITTHRFDMTYEYTEIPPVRVTSDFSTYESFDGERFNFNLQRKRGGVVYEEIRGVADSPDGAVQHTANYSLPKDLSFELPEETLFPMAHTLQVLEKIKNGKKFYKATLFDGSDAEGPVDINSFITKAAAYKVPESYKPYIDDKLVAAPGWKVRLAFFPLHNYDVLSDYEMSLIFHENGVITDMEVEYGDFSVTQKLRAIEALGDACTDNIEDTEQ